MSSGTQFKSHVPMQIPCLCLRAQRDATAVANLLNLKIWAGRACKQLRSEKTHKGSRRKVMSTHTAKARSHVLSQPLWFAQGCMGIRESGLWGFYPLCNTLARKVKQTGPEVFHRRPHSCPQGGLVGTGLAEVWLQHLGPAGCWCTAEVGPITSSELRHIFIQPY